MTASQPPATADDGLARERKHEQRKRVASVTLTVDAGMGVKGKTKDGLKEDRRMVAVLVSQAPSIAPLLSPFFYFCLLRHSITSSR